MEQWDDYKKDHVEILDTPKAIFQFHHENPGICTFSQKIRKFSILTSYISAFSPHSRHPAIDANIFQFED